MIGAILLLLLWCDQSLLDRVVAGRVVDMQQSGRGW